MKPITSVNYAGVECVLVFDNGKIAEIGDQTIVGELTGGRAPNKQNSIGKIWVRNNEETKEYSPSVIDASWKELNHVDAGRRNSR